MTEVAIKISNYKCFVEENGFDEIKRMNLIIGRNNVGKSALLDLVEAVCNKRYKFPQNTWSSPQHPSVAVELNIKEDEAKSVFRENSSGGSIKGNHWQYGRQLIGRKVKIKKNGEGRERKNGFVEIDDEGIQPKIEDTGYHEKLAAAVNMPLEGKTPRRLSAERDVRAEEDNGGSTEINENGAGITTALQRFLNRSNLPSKVVEKDILEGLNEIFEGDTTFQGIVCQLHDDDSWEIFLEENDKGRIALSSSGSGLKTVVSVLSYLKLLPKIEDKNLDDYVFCFEELENNMHPSLLRKLSDYIDRSSKENSFSVFMTTHSNVLIDQYNQNSDAQIVHINQCDNGAQCNTARTYIENNGILDDLDVRASDLLQANGILWVEGPSDRIYLSKWIDLMSDGALKEGVHYQVIFYGGRLLSHLSAEINDGESGVELFRANRNSAIIIDSDKRAKGSRINNTKKRIRDEFSEMEAVCWITKGKEVENYIPASAVAEFLGKENAEQVGQYQDFFDYLNNERKDLGEYYRNKKPILAEDISKYITKGRLEEVLDLAESVHSICETIRRWNSQ